LGFLADEFSRTDNSIFAIRQKSPNRRLRGDWSSLVLIFLETRFYIAIFPNTVKALDIFCSARIKFAAQRMPFGLDAVGKCIKEHS